MWEANRWRLLAEFEARRAESIGWYRLDDGASCDGLACGSRVMPVPPLNFDAWPACPVSLLRGSPWQFIVMLYNAKNVNPLSGWPDRFAAWVVDGLIALHQAIEAKQSDDMKQTQERMKAKR